METGNKNIRENNSENKDNDSIHRDVVIFILLNSEYNVEV